MITTDDMEQELDTDPVSYLCPECDGAMFMHSHRIYYTAGCVNSHHWHCHNCGADFTHNLTRLILDELGCVMMLDIENG